MCLGCICVDFLDVRSHPKWSSTALQHLYRLYSSGSCLTLWPNHPAPSSFLLRTHPPLSLLCSSLSDILLSQLIKWLVHSYISGVSPYVTHSREPLKLALSHHPVCFYQSTDLYLKLCAYYLITVPHIHKIVGELQGGLVFCSSLYPQLLKRLHVINTSWFCHEPITALKKN